MIPVTSFAGKTVAVFGLGGSGLASCHALRAGGAEVIASDDSAEKLAEAAQAGFITADLRKIPWTNFAALVLTPGAPLTHPSPHWTVLAAQQAGVEVIGDVELFCRERRRHAPDAPFVAITGTNGKSTTTALIAHLMRFAGYDTQMGGNIGTAILSLEPPRMGRVHVIEMSSYQIDLSPSLDPSVGILLNVSEDHIDRHGTLEHYAAVKERLVAGVQPQGAAIVGVDDTWSRNTADRIEQVGRRGSVLFVNDSKGTNADAAAHALSSFADIFWIAGGKPKLGGIAGLSQYFPRIRKAYLIGEAAQEFSETLGDRVPHEISETLDVAVASAARDAEASGLSDPVVLLSPACASFDQYRNFEIRGTKFRDLVTALPGVKPVV